MKKQTWKMSNTSYDKKPEYIARDVLNEKLKLVRLTGNPNKYDLDLKVWQRGKRKHLGFVEIEVAQNGWYSDWYEISFLWRKFLNAMNESALDRTIYFKFRNDFTDCFCASMWKVLNHPDARFSDRTGMNKNILNLRNDTYISLPMTHIEIIKCSMYNVPEFIDNFFTRGRV